MNITYSSMAETSQPKTESEIKFIELAKSQPEGLSNDDIKKNLPEIPLEEVTAIINKCLKNGSLDLFQTKNGLFYKYREPSTKVPVLGADNEEKVVYKIIQESGNKGIWIRDIRSKADLTITQLNKVLKSLTMKKIIKAVKSVAASKKKVYMLYDLEPDSSVTGGAWYQDQDFESEFVDVLSQQCHRFLVQKWEDSNNLEDGPLIIRNKSYATAKDVHKFISELGISKVQLSVQDIESILYTVVLDDNAERIVTSDGSHLYRATKRFMASPGLVKTTCGICPVANRCAETGFVNPRACTYLTDWLNN